MHGPPTGRRSPSAFGRCRRRLTSHRRSLLFPPPLLPSYCAVLTRANPMPAGLQNNSSAGRYTNVSQRRDGKKMKPGDFSQITISSLMHDLTLHTSCRGLPVAIPHSALRIRIPHPCQPRHVIIHCNVPTRGRGTVTPSPGMDSVILGENGTPAVIQWPSRHEPSTCLRQDADAELWPPFVPSSRVFPCTLCSPRLP